jgi:uncharacterized protein YeaO (DUF488 family)/DNA-binding MarR family transcriptional regulator
MTLSDEDYTRLLALRAGLRHFQRWSEQQAKAAGLTPAQHQLLLAIRGHGDPRGPTVGEVADYLLRGHHSTVELIDRADSAGLVTRRRDPDDHRVVRLQLTDLGSERLEALSALHLEELDRLALHLPATWEGLAPVQRTHGFAGDPSSKHEPVEVGLVRVYDHPPRRGRRLILVDRLWPRGLSRDDEVFDMWLKDVAPSTELRKWYGHAPNRFDEFSRRYRKELTKESTRDALRQLRELTSAEEVVLVTATKDLERSAAAVLRDLLSGI